tara:strand:+ start:4934 stop:5161 length:228 start_codon:yes stop_codon:yes gene_type:complete
MLLPVFKNSKEVKTFLSYGDAGDAWCFQMVKEFVDMCGLSVDNLEDLDINELNEWLETELGSFQQGYEDYIDNQL